MIAIASRCPSALIVLFVVTYGEDAIIIKNESVRPYSEAHPVRRRIVSVLNKLMRQCRVALQVA